MGILLGPDDTVTLDPDLVLVIFLPPLLYSSAFFANLHDLRRGMRVITVNAVGLVLVTMCTVAVVAHEVRRRHLVAGGVRARRHRLAHRSGGARPRSCAGCSVPRRMVSIIEGESLLNDGTALVAYNARSAAVATSFVFWDAAGDFVGERRRRHRDRARRRQDPRRRSGGRIDDIPTEVTISLPQWLRRLPAGRGGGRLRRARHRHDRHRARLGGAADLDARRCA